MFCPFCGNVIDDDALTCNACNSPVKPLKKTDAPETVTEQEPAAEQETTVQPEVAPQPETDSAQDAAAEPEVAPQPEVIVQPEAVTEPEAATLSWTEEPPKKRRNGLRIVLGTLGIAVVLAGIVWLVVYLMPILAGKGPATALYIKDNELYSTRLSKIQPWQITEKLVDASRADINALDKNNKDILARRLTAVTYMTRDGKTLFYPDKYKLDNPYSVDIYYRNIKNPEEAPQKLDSNISLYTISPYGERVVYLTDDGNLYRFDMQEKVKIASEVQNFLASEDCKNIIYSVDNQDGTEENPSSTLSMYAQTEGKEKQKLASDCKSVAYVSDNCSTLYYINDESKLYKVTVGSDKEKIASNVSTVHTVYETGELYYSTKAPYSGSGQFYAAQFVENDMPGNPEKSQLMTQLYQRTLSANYAESICYYDGKESHKLSGDCVYGFGNSGFAWAMDTPVFVYSLCDVGNVEKVKLSQITDVNDAVTKIRENASQANRVFVAVRGTATHLQCESKSVTAANVRITENGLTGYYYVPQKSSGGFKGDLYKFAIAGGKPQKAELYASEIYNSFRILNNDTLLYFKDVSDKKYTGDLYINNTLVDYAVGVHTANYDADNHALYYMIDMNTDRTNGTLQVWQDGDKTKIADEVVDYRYIDDEVLYLTDYNENKGFGTLYQFENDESKQVDIEVSYIIHNNEKYGLVWRDRMMQLMGNVYYP